MAGSQLPFGVKYHLQVELWDAINRFADAPRLSVARQRAVVEVEDIIEKLRNHDTDAERADCEARVARFAEGLAIAHAAGIEEGRRQMQEEIERRLLAKSNDYFDRSEASQSPAVRRMLANEAQGIAIAAALVRDMDEAELRERIRAALKGGG